MQNNRFIITVSMMEEAVKGFGKVIGFTQTKMGSIGVIEFKNPVNITLGMHNIKDNQVSLNGYAGGIGEAGFFIKNPSRPFSVSIRQGQVGNPYFVTNDKKTFIFSFKLFFGKDELEKEFYDNEYDIQKKIVVKGARLFFERISTSGMNVWQEEHYSCRDFTTSEMNHELDRMADWWFGSCVLHVG